MKILEIFEIQKTPLFGIKPYNIPVIHKTKGTTVTVRGLKPLTAVINSRKQFQHFSATSEQTKSKFFYLCGK